MWTYFNPVFDYEKDLQDLAWPWSGHKYFAYDLIVNLKPKKIVELGTHYGTSFWSFAQAVKDNNLNTELNAVDTWQGDQHAGFYQEDVWQAVNKIKDSHYSKVNINLIRRTFDEAVSDFEDDSIDILHIDGLHTYEAVQHDFVSWLPKMKKDGIVLFHDIMVDRDDFGVFRLWDELKQQYRTFEFHHSYGLGVLFLYSENSLLSLKKSIERHYSWFSKEKESGKIAQEINNLSSKDQELQQKDQLINEKDQELQQKDQLINEKDQELQQKDQLINEKDQELLFVKSSKFWKLREFYIKLKKYGK